jgi:hypothetical protein
MPDDTLGLDGILEDGIGASGTQQHRYYSAQILTCSR